MPGNRWTDEQRRVIDERSGNLIVSAAAGSGKTAVLVERILAMVSQGESPVDIDRLLVVTFTNAAAAEMKERIAAALERRLLEEPGNEHLKRQQLLIHNAHIMTIHSFCLSVIRNYFQLISLDPSFRIAEEEELTLIKSDVMSELFEENYINGREDFMDLVERYGTSKSDKAVEELIAGLHSFASGNPWPERWLEEQLCSYKIDDVPDMENKPWMKQLMDYCHMMLGAASSINRQMKSLAGSSRELSFYLDMIRSDEELLDLLRGETTYYGMSEAISCAVFVRMPSRRGGVPEGEERERLELQKEELRQLRGRVKDIVASLKKKFFFQEPEEMAGDITKTLKPAEALIRLALDFGRKFAARKEKLNIIDFNDIEHFALKILLDGEGDSSKPSDAALELRNSFSEIMVDEYQDSNLVQEYILNAVAGKGGLRPYMFTVGDVKQSIYKFRLARPSLFLDRCRRYADGSEGRCISLHVNFRSRAGVIESVNSLFRKVMHTSVGGIEYDDEAALNVGSDYPEPEDEGMRSELRIIDVAGMDDIKEDSIRRIEALDIARRIRELTGEKGLRIYDRDTKSLRPCRYGDIAVLLRTMAGWSEEFTDALSELGIPAYSDIQAGFFGTVEIQTMLNYLRLMDNPLQDIPCAAALHSPVCGLDSDELAQLRIFGGPGIRYFEAARAYAAEGPCRELREKLAAFFEDYNILKELQRGSTLPEVILAVYRRTGYYDYVTALPGGDRRRANLDLLAEKAAAFEQTSFHGLFGFIRYIEKLEKYEIDYGEAVGESGGDAVRIMSIHKSKGLEFPVVLLAGMGKQFNRTDSRAKAVIHPDYGIGLDCVDIKLRTKIPTLIKRAISQITVNEGVGEELRVLYVAMTRAREKLIVSGTVNGLGKLKAGDGGVADCCDIIAAPGFMDIIYPAADDRCFDVSFTDAAAVVEGESRYYEELERRSLDVGEWTADEASVAEVQAARDLAYGFDGLRGLPVKVSVSELKEAQEDDGTLLILPEREDMTDEIAEANPAESRGGESGDMPLPSFMGSDKQPQGAALGSLYHKVMQFITFDIRGEAEVTAFLEDLVRRGFMEEAEIGRLEPQRFADFLSTGLAGRMDTAMRAGRLWRERAFVISVPAGRIYSDCGGTENVLVQGIIDAYFEEDGGLVLLDYKTDRVDSTNTLSLRYKTQLDYYGEALGRLTGMTVREKLIYSFYLGELVSL